MKNEVRSGWGRTSFTSSFILPVDNFQGKKYQTREESGLPIGLGRSYGDSSINSLGISWSCENRKKILIDKEKVVAYCDSGVTIGELERAAAMHGLFPPVVPGTEFVTIGGAIASNVHGKSHHLFGSFGDQIVEMSLLDSNGRVHLLSAQGENSDLFWATVGGMGLTGIIISAIIQMHPIETTFFVCKEIRVNKLSEAIATLNHLDKEFAYTVAWIDFSGRYQGRGLVSAGNHAKVNELPVSKNMNPLMQKIPKNIKLPDIFPAKTINKFTVRIFNEIWFRKRLVNGIKHFQQFLHPLDSVQNWNRIYGKRGLIQYQFQIPEGNEEFLYKVMKKLKAINAASFLVVLKKFGSSEHGLLSFPKSGWTLAVDLPAGLKGLDSCLNELDSELIKLGGRVYLTKDQRLSRENFEKMYPEIKKWKAIKSQIDPNNYWRSDQGRRLGLC